MSLANDQSWLADITSGIRLHRGGEAEIFLICPSSGNLLVFKRFLQPFNESLVEKVSNIKECGICKIRDFGFYQNSPYQIYDFVEGVASDSLGKIPVAVALKALRQIAVSLACARKKGVSHGDLNPANVIFSVVQDGETENFQTVLIDWGIMGPGSLAFAAPERFQGKEAEEKSDMFSLGMLLFRWIAGSNLVEGDSFDQFALQNAGLSVERVSEKLFLSGGFSAEEISALEPIWASTLACNPEDRAEDLDELDEVLEIALDKIGGGEVSLSTCSRGFAGQILPVIQKAGQKFSQDLKNPEKQELPFKKRFPKKERNRTKIAIFSGLGILLLVIALLIVLGTETPDVDDTGELILRKSRDLNMDRMEESSPSEDLVPDSLSVNRLLNDLPIPSKE